MNANEHESGATQGNVVAAPPRAEGSMDMMDRMDKMDRMDSGTGALRGRKV